MYSVFGNSYEKSQGTVVPTTHQKFIAPKDIHNQKAYTLHQKLAQKLLHSKLEEILLHTNKITAELNKIMTLNHNKNNLRLSRKNNEKHTLPNTNSTHKPITIPKSISRAMNWIY